eukprot:2749309-Rhodomonas_salina.2
MSYISTTSSRAQVAHGALNQYRASPHTVANHALHQYRASHTACAGKLAESGGTVRGRAAVGHVRMALMKNGFNCRQSSGTSIGSSCASWPPAPPAPGPAVLLRLLLLLCGGCL